MLNSLEIKNIALIENLSVEFHDRMTVLTGETGAGKSIIIDSVNLILGARANKGLIRYGEEKARVQALFTVSEAIAKKLSELGIEQEDDAVAVLRDISADGRSVCRINGMIVPQTLLRRASELLVNIHGQQDNQALLNPKYHLEYLDNYAQCAKQKEEYKKAYENWRAVSKKLAGLKCDEQERAARVDLLTYQTNELIEADLKKGEKEELLKQRELMQNAEELNTAVSLSCALLYDGEENSAYDSVSRAAGALSKITQISGVDKAYEKICDIKYAIEDIAHEIRDFADGAEFSEAGLDEIETRLDKISKMEKKYGGSVEAALEYLDAASEELAELDAGEELFEELEEKLEAAEKEMHRAAAELTRARKSAGEKLSGEIEKVLFELDMPKVRFAVSITPTDCSASGADIAEFMICPNVGEELKPLAKFASGGELSRVMLAMKSILADADDAETLIFDEIDTGVSGSAAQKIAHKLSQLGKKKQVICVSHQPQLAACADWHMLIKKTQSGGRTTTGITELDKEARVRELARIIDGDNLSEAAILHAKAMLENA